MLIVHLSDIHYKVNSEISFIPFYEAIKHKISSNNNVVTVISGDIAFSGKSEEYERFHEEYTKLKNKILSENDQKQIDLILAPGNHDCNFDRNNDSRNMIVESVKMNGYKSVSDDSILNLCTSIQYDFFDYLKNNSAIDIKDNFNRICWQKTIEADSCSVIFTIYNTAWLSTYKEDAGSLYFPTDMIHGVHGDNRLHSYKIGIYHHPDNWISPKHDEQNHREFRNQVTRYNSLILNGHEHQEHLEQYNDLSNGHDCHIHAGGAFFQNGKYEKFSTIELLSEGKLDVEKYAYDNEKKIYTSSKIITDNLTKLSKINHNYELIPSYKEYLNDTEVYISNSDQIKLTLKDLFTYPRIENIESEKIVDSEKILKDKNTNNVVLFGSDQSGKTSILKTLYQYWYYHGCTPILIDTCNITNLNVRQLLKNNYRKQYNEHKTSFDQYLSLEYDKKIILVDNFHFLKSTLNKDAILKELKSFSNRIILVCDDISALEETSLGSEENKVFEKYSILPFGHINRDTLIEKWLSKLNLTHEEIFSRKKQVHSQLNDILGSNLVPAYPLFILTVLQSLDATTPLKAEITSYGHCYQALIYLSFAKNGLKEDEFEVVDNFLSYVSNSMYELDERYLSKDRLNDLYVTFGEKFITTHEFSDLIRILIDSKIIIEDSVGNLAFKYIYIYYYYTAKYFSKYKLQEKGFIEKLCENIEKKENSFIILFITHHSPNPKVIEEIIYSSMDQFTDLDPITLINSETDFMINSVELASSTVLENIKPEDYHKEQLASKDNIEVKDTKEKISDVNEHINKINKALKSIEINGQLLKVRYGSIEIEKLKNIIEESFLICFRLIKFLVTDLSNEETITILADQFEEYIKLNNSKISSSPTRLELINAIQKALSNITYYICHFTLDKTAYFIGNDKLSKLYKEIAYEIDTPASKLTLMLIDFKTTKNKLDKVRIKELKEEFKDNTFAYSILQKAAVNYIYMHHLKHEDKSWIASTLNIPVVDQRKIENKKNK